MNVKRNDPVKLKRLSLNNEKGMTKDVKTTHVHIENRNSYIHDSLDTIFSHPTEHNIKFSRITNKHKYR